MNWTIEVSFGSIGTTIVGFLTRKEARTWWKKYKHLYAVCGYGWKRKKVSIKGKL